MNYKVLIYHEIYHAEVETQKKVFHYNGINCCLEIGFQTVYQHTARRKRSNRGT